MCFLSGCAATNWVEHYSDENNCTYWQYMDAGETTWVQPPDSATANPLSNTEPTTATTATTDIQSTTFGRTV